MPAQASMRSTTASAEFPQGDKRVIVYRVEDSDGFGYKHSLDSGIGSLICIDYVGYEQRRPLPGDDGIDLDNLDSEWFFGFESLEMLKSWFSLNERNAGAFLGGKILLIEVAERHLVKGCRQLAFDNRFARTVAAHPLNAFDAPEIRTVDFEDL